MGHKTDSNLITQITIKFKVLFVTNSTYLYMVQWNAFQYCADSKKRNLIFKITVHTEDN